ncbi:MAG TPA: DUF222 domain-containing protein [Actinomycetota bacterium]
MSSIRSAVEDLCSREVDGLSDAGLEEEFDEFTWACRAMQAHWLKLLAKIDDRHAFSRDGFWSAASWLAVHARESHAASTEQVKTACALEDMPVVRDAYGEGEISASAVRVLTTAHDTHPELFAEAEPMLVEAAKALMPREFAYAVRYWRQAADAARAERAADERHDQRRLSVSATAFGMVRVDGDLDPETGQSLITALRAVVDAEVRAGGAVGPRTPGQRRADALGEICRQWLDRKDRPAVAGERPHVTLTVGLDALRGHAVSNGDATGSPEPCALQDAGPVTPGVARRIACDASISRIVMGPRSEPLDVGRRTAVVPAGLRRAVAARDRQCRFPSCDRPEAWCDAHHVVHWADGGVTALGNLVLLCRRHHRMVHGTSGFRLSMENGEPVFRRPDGSVLDDRAPPRL